MSVIPLRTISGSLPVIFIEARLYGDPECVVNQLGFSLDADQYNIAMLTRTSRVMLVVGVGSYMMYRIFLRLWDRGFIWTVVDQLRLDSIPRSDCQILFQSAKYQRCNEIASSSTKSVDGCTRSCSACGYFSPRHRLSYSKHRPCISSSSKYDSDPSRRSGVPSNLRDGMQGVTFVNSRDLLSKLESEASEGLSQLSGSIASGCSASLRLVWDDQEWDDEFDFSTTGIVHRGQCPTPSSVSEMSEFRTAKEIFGAASPSPTPVEIRKACGSEDESPSVRGDVGESVSEDMELVHKNCMTDSRHFYETAIGSLTESEAQSLCSGRSNRSFMSLRQRAAANEYCRGLLDLSCRSLKDCEESFVANAMTDSGFISKATSSSDRLYRKNFLDLISEDDASAIISDDGFEWFSEGFSESSVQQKEILDQPSTSFSQNPEVLNKTASSKTSLVKQSRLRGTRDLMVWGREKFAMDGSVIKMLHILYTSKRLKRIGVERSRNSLAHFILSLLHLMFYQNVRIIPFEKFGDVEKVVHDAVRRFGFLQTWQFPDTVLRQKNDYHDQLSETVMIDVLRSLWNLQATPTSLEDPSKEDSYIEAVLLLTLLRTMQEFQLCQSGAMGSQSGFYSELFDEFDPRQIMLRLREGLLEELEISQIAASLRVHIKVFDGERSGQPIIYGLQSVSTESSPPSLHFLRCGPSSLYPLYYISE